MTSLQSPADLVSPEVATCGDVVEFRFNV